MRVEFPYGSGTLAVELPAATTVLAPADLVGTADPVGTVARAVAHPVAGAPLSDLVRLGMRVAIAVCDGTRPQPRETVLSGIFRALGEQLADSDVTVLVATGSHRANTSDELLEMFGAELCARLSIINHDARDEHSLVDMGTMGAGVPVKLNRHWVEADVRITTGFVEPHFFAGFSGGPKLVAPGLAGIDTILRLHDFARIASADATWGSIENNPVQDDVRAIAAATGVDFACDVLLNRRHEVVSAFAGELFAMHAAARASAEASCAVVAPQRYDVVVTSNAGYPLDQNLYQAVKGMSAAARLVRDDGVIVVLAECRDGVPDHGEFAALLASAQSPAALLASLATSGTTRPDQWQAQILAALRERARICVHSSGLHPDQLRAAFLEPVDDVDALIADEMRRRGPHARCCALPRGPETLAQVQAGSDSG